MKPWFVLFVLWALSGIVTLRHVYETGGSATETPRRTAQVADEPAYLF